MGTEDADDSDTQDDDDDEGNPPADSAVQPASWPFYEQLLFLRDTMTARKTSGNFKPQKRQKKQDIRQVGRQERAESLFREMSHSQFDSIKFDETDDHAGLYPAPVVSVECAPLLPEPASLLLESTQSSSESARSALGTAPSLGLAATSLQSQGSSLASMSAMQTPKKKKKKDDDDSLLIEHLGKLTKSLEEQDDHYHLALSLVRPMREAKD
ncbi:uncharacterized protein LOC144166749 [Haemaphysalis longicornis]